MAQSFPARPVRLAITLLAVALAAGPARAQYGLLFSGAGPVNRGMGGVGVATANDPTGAIFWNPATMSGLDGSQAALGVELLYPQSRVASTFRASSLGFGIPPVAVIGHRRVGDEIVAGQKLGPAERPQVRMVEPDAGIQVGNDYIGASRTRSDIPRGNRVDRRRLVVLLIPLIRKQRIVGQSVGIAALIHVD